MKSVRLNVKGRVQGVGFRSYVLHAARRYGISGYVRNLEDGSIEVLAQGLDLSAFLSHAMRGPATARIDAIKVDHLDAPGFEGFEVRA